MSAGFEELVSSDLDLDGDRDLATLTSGSFTSRSEDESSSLESDSGFFGNNKSKLISLSDPDFFEPLGLRLSGFDPDL